MQSFHDKGYAVIENFITEDEINTLKDRAYELIEGFYPEDQNSIFHSFFNGGKREKDRYILDSANGIHFFLEEKALDKEGKLIGPKNQSICKIGHAMHDLDPVFDKFSRAKKIESVAKEIGFKNPLLAQSMYFFKNPRIAGEIGLHQDDFSNEKSVLTDTKLQASLCSLSASTGGAQIAHLSDLYSG